MRLIRCSVLLIILQVGSLQARYEPHSCNLEGASAPPRDVYFMGQKRKVAFQESDRLQHKLINAVLIILATEKLGYRNLTTVPEPLDGHSKLKALIGTNESQWPEAVINVEMQVLGQPLHNQVENRGLTGTSTQYRWWLHSPPDDTVNCRLARYLDFYINPELVHECYQRKKFLEESDQLLSEFRERFNNCPDKNETCKVILSTHKNETSFLEEHVKWLSNFVIIWLGESLNAVVKELRHNRNDSFFIVDTISWNTNTTVMVDYGRTSCENFKSKEACPYEKIIYGKVVLYLIERVKKLDKMITNFSMTKQVDSLISEYRSQGKSNVQDAIEKSACSWLKSPSNTELVESWIDKKPPEIMITLFYCTGDQSQIVLHNVTVLTVIYINKKGILNDTYKLKMRSRMIDCYSKGLALMVKVFSDELSSIYYDTMAGFLMPAVPQALDIALGLSKSYQTPVFTFNPDGPSLARRKEYPNAFRTVGEKNVLHKAYLQLCSEFGWKRMAAVSGYNQSNVDFISLLGQYLNKNGVKFAYEKTTEINSKTSIMKALENLKNKNARIILVDVDLSRAEELFLTAHELDMLPSEGYVWLLPDWAPSFYARLKDLDAIRAEKIKQVLDGHLNLMFSSISDDPTEDRTMEEFRGILRDYSKRSNDDDYSKAGFVADAIWTLALSVKQLIVNHAGAEDDIHGTVSILSNYIDKQKFDGVAGTVEFYEGSMRTSHIEINQWSTNGSYLKIANIGVHADNDETVWVTKSNARWGKLNNEIPGDGSSHCVFPQNTNEFYIICNDIPIFGAVAAIIVTITIFLIIFMFGLKKHKSKINLLLNALKNTNPTLINRLHSYEVPRDNVDMHWEIGKGSFGKVFGGYLKMDDETWSKVAIKILKTDASNEDEQDFLYEAQTMASFDHKNIVKLMAVCTVGTPILIVMELMLFEDLKKFLITKRHLLDDSNSLQLTCITPKKLTTMALDVAMALSYLASKKFVHRDVASRNCMVNSHGVVKLGDFGMTRYVFSKGEYMCQRKGLFPVRWMAPESLKDGTFTSKSDVWSYGILLYEIITFGSTPYKTIKESRYVKEFIVNGNIIRLPSGVNSQLKWLMEQCWSYDDSKRPSAADIVVYLADRSNLLHPCLDGPLEKRFTGPTVVAANTGDTPTIRVDSRGCDTTDTWSLSYKTVHDRKDSGYEPDDSPYRLNSLTSVSKL